MRTLSTGKVRFTHCCSLNHLPGGIILPSGKRSPDKYAPGFLPASPFPHTRAPYYRQASSPRARGPSGQSTSLPRHGPPAGEPARRNVFTVACPGKNGIKRGPGLLKVPALLTVDGRFNCSCGQPTGRRRKCRKRCKTGTLPLPRASRLYA